ncbi:OmpA family protein [Lysobacter pythonis]|uniref:OmpA family protein n=1 Tax=Solilutibacter pythonis TaxID=2483112 RepID=A0A3M2I5T3_9GAMM|nr:OmpA family protein [Lysobacter pythonis]RMH93817.1 OmpA family protein [Lysobacter pythonis]
MKKILICLALTTGLATGCKKPPENAIATDPTATPPATESATPAKTGFDIDSVPVSTATLGDFPYITLPRGYRSNGDPVDKEFARFPFWVDGNAHWVEGRFHEVNILTEDDKQYAPLEVRRNLEALVQQLGGVKVSEGKIPGEAIEGFGEEVTMGFRTGIGDVYNEPVTTYLVRRNDGNIWIHFVQNTSEGWMTIGREQAFQQTATLLPTSELKKQIDANGKVALQVNFATDKTDILPESMPQIEQVAALLKEDPQLELDINGHTDSTGDKIHNLKLSEGRARSVLATLETKGIDASRLGAKGYGDTQPVADNTTEEGKAKNRRVELIKR